MPTWYLTPAALGYLSQLILALMITGYFVARLMARGASRPAHMVLLTGFFACIAVLILLFFLGAAFPPTERLYALFLENTVLALGIVLLLQFAYRFPASFPHKWEARLALASSLAYLLFEAGYAGYRFYLLLLALAFDFALRPLRQKSLPRIMGKLWQFGVSSLPGGARGPVLARGEYLRQDCRSGWGCQPEFTQQGRGVFGVSADRREVVPHQPVVAVVRAGEFGSLWRFSPGGHWSVGLPAGSTGSESYCR